MSGIFLANFTFMEANFYKWTLYPIKIKEKCYIILNIFLIVFFFI